MGATAGRAERERERLRKLEARRKHERWLNPSVAQLQEEHEYMDWLSALADPEGDAEQDDSWATFMAERRVQSEKARLLERTRHSKQ